MGSFLLFIALILLLYVIGFLALYLTAYLLLLPFFMAGTALRYFLTENRETRLAETWRLYIKSVFRKKIIRRTALVLMIPLFYSYGFFMDWTLHRHMTNATRMEIELYLSSLQPKPILYKTESPEEMQKIAQCIQTRASLSCLLGGSLCSPEMKFKYYAGDKLVYSFGLYHRKAIGIGMPHPYQPFYPEEIPLTPASQSHLKQFLEERGVFDASLYARKKGLS